MTKTKPRAKKTEQQEIKIPAMALKTATIALVGDSGLICNKWSQKAKQEMLDKQMKKAKTAKAAKDPEQNYRESLYEHPAGGFGFPSVAFKSAAVDACSHISNVTKVEARGSFHIMGDLVKIDGKPSMREDMVRVGMGTADIRYRGEFKKWSVKLRISYNANVLSLEQIMNLFNTAGFAIGVGEWRPQKNGSFGMFHVV